MKGNQNELINNRVFYLEKDISTVEAVSMDYDVKLINYNNDKDIEQWSIIINSAYDDAYYDIAEARKLLLSHPYLSNCQSVIIFSGVNPVGTVSWGYLKDSLIGGIFRIGVLPMTRSVLTLQHQ